MKKLAFKKVHANHETYNFLAHRNKCPYLKIFPLFSHRLKTDECSENKQEKVLCLK